MKIVNNKLISVDQSDLKDGVFYHAAITEIADKCFLKMPKLREINLPKVKKIGSDCLSDNQALTSVTLPAAATFGSYCLSYNQALTSVTLPAAATFGSYCLSYNQALTSVTLPAATTFGSDCLSDNQALTSVTLPAAATFGSYCLRSNQALTSVTLPAATTFGNYCLRYNQALTSVTLPAATTFGSYCLRSNQALTSVTLPAATTFGNYCLSYNQALTIVTLQKQKLSVKNIDGFCFIIKNKKSSKGIIIYSGGNFSKMEDRKIITHPCFVAEKEGFTAHGETVKKAITDLQFKIVSEKLKKEPITPNTLLTVKYYRLLTGACDLGCREWMKNNEIPFIIEGEETKETKPYKAVQLLPLLKKTQAYGLERILSLITF